MTEPEDLNDIIDAVIASVEDDIYMPEVGIDVDRWRKETQVAIDAAIARGDIPASEWREHSIRTTVTTRIQTKRNSRRLKFDKKTGEPRIRTNSLLNIADMWDVRVLDATHDHWLAHNMKVQSNRSDVVREAERCNELVTVELPPLYKAYGGNMQRIAEAKGWIAEALPFEE